MQESQKPNAAWNHEVHVSCDRNTSVILIEHALQLQHCTINASHEIEVRTKSKSPSGNCALLLELIDHTHKKVFHLNLTHYAQRRFSIEAIARPKNSNDYKELNAAEIKSLARRLQIYLTSKRFSHASNESKADLELKSELLNVFFPSLRKYF